MTYGTLYVQVHQRALFAHLVERSVRNKSMIKALSSWLDRRLGVSPRMGLPIALLAFAVVSQWVALGITLARRFGLLN
jgi:hypothetical protein